MFTSLVPENRSGLHYIITKPTKVIHFHLVNPHRSNRTLPPPKKKKEKKEKKRKKTPKQTNNIKKQNIF